MTYGDVVLNIGIIPVDTVKKCGTTSNLQLVKFIWDLNTFYFLKYATCVMPATSAYVTYLRHYRSESDGWLNRRQIAGHKKSGSKHPQFHFGIYHMRNRLV